MKILALDFSSSRRVAAVLEDRSGAVVTLAETVIERPASEPLPWVNAALETSETTAADVDLIAVGLGPGSFTGIRSAIVLAQSWNLVRGVSAVGVAGFDVMASSLARDGRRGQVLLAANAGRNEVYATPYELADGTAAPSAEPRLMSLDEVRSQVAGGSLVAGSDLGGLIEGAFAVFPDAAVLATLGLARGERIDASDMTPIYGRQPAFVKAPPVRGRKSKAKPGSF